MKPEMIADVTLVGRRLDLALKEAGKDVDTLCAQAGVGRTTLYRWLRGKQEGGCCEVARVATLLNLRPNDILLRNPSETGCEPSGVELSPEDEYALSKIRVYIARMNRLAGGTRRPADTIADMCKEVVETFEPPEEPKGLLIEETQIPPIGSEPGKTVKAFDPMKRKGRNEGYSQASEARADYGKKKK